MIYNYVIKVDNIQYWEAIYWLRLKQVGWTEMQKFPFLRIQLMITVCFYHVLLYQLDSLQTIHSTYV